MVDCALGEIAAERLAEAAPRQACRDPSCCSRPTSAALSGRSSSSGYEGWLVKPVRGASLASRLRPPAASPAARPVRPRPARRPAAGLRVLLAEDNEINTLVAMHVLGRLGAQVVHASDGGSALALATAAMRGEIPSLRRHSDGRLHAGARRARSHAARSGPPRRGRAGPRSASSPSPPMRSRTITTAASRPAWMPSPQSRSTREPSMPRFVPRARRRISAPPAEHRQGWAKARALAPVAVHKPSGFGLRVLCMVQALEVKRLTWALASVAAILCRGLDRDRYAPHHRA